MSQKEKPDIVISFFRAVLWFFGFLFCGALNDCNQEAYFESEQINTQQRMQKYRDDSDRAVGKNPTSLVCDKGKNKSC